MEQYIAGKWCVASRTTEVLHPYDGRVIDVVPQSDGGDVSKALDAAEAGAKDMAGLSAYEVNSILTNAAGRIESQKESFAKTICLESGKPIREARAEVSRAVETMRLSAEQAKRIYGEVLPLDADPRGAGKVGLTMRIPCGVVVAISPFNFPLNLVAHKIGPALAAKNAVILKPASDTPLSALMLTRALLDSGLPPMGIQCITGTGKDVGAPLCADPRVRKISFTGSRDVGEAITKAAGIKRVTLELGSNCALIVMPDADLALAAKATVQSGYSNAGQVCIATQRVLVHEAVLAAFNDTLVSEVGKLCVGAPENEQTDVGALIRPKEVTRLSSWLQESVDAGARLLIGGDSSGAVMMPGVIADVTSDMKVFREELFGPLVCVTSFSNAEQALRLANDTNFGLAASIFTKDIETSWQFARECRAGNLHINSGPSWRADLMPYGGLGDSGIGQEGPRYAVEGMTEVKTVVFHNA